MPDYILILPPIVGGYYLLLRFDLTRYRAKNLSNQRLLFEVAGVGIVLVLLARLLIVGARSISVAPIQGTLQDFLSWWHHTFAPLPYAGTALLAAGLGIVLAEGLNRLGDRDVAARLAYEIYGDQLALLFLRAQGDEDQKARPLMLTLRNRKVYTGLVFRSPAPDEEDPFLILLPTKSGYRHPDTLKVHWTDFYHQAYAHLDDETGIGTEEDLGILIPLEEILLATIYRENIPDGAFEKPWPDKPRPTENTSVEIISNRH